VSPILVRPVREQLEHDRVTRLLQARFRRRFDVGINPGSEQNAPVGSGPSALYPDVVLMSLERGRRLQAVIEVETGESVNNLEAIAQWAQFARLRQPFHLYVPAGSVDVARRLCTDNNILVAEIQSYHVVGGQMRFTPVYKAPAGSRAVTRSSQVRARRTATRPKVSAAKRAKKAKAAAPRRSAKPARRPSGARKRR
jgi:hypothetical protein